MFRRTLCMLLIAGVVAYVAACEDDETGLEPETFQATLTGAAERPNPVTTTATGSATFTVRGSSVDFTINVANLVGATAAHIHGPASTATAAGVLVTLFSAAAPGVNVVNGELESGTFPSSTFSLTSGITLDSVLVLLRNGNAYVNVHTVTNQAGEIRGQLTSN